MKLEESLNNNKILNLLGLANKAKKIVLGQKVLEEITNIKYLFIANDSSINSQSKYLNKCKYYNIAYSTRYSSKELSDALGQVNRNVIGVIDAGFSKHFVELNKEVYYGKSEQS